MPDIDKPQVGTGQHNNAGVVSFCVVGAHAPHGDWCLCKSCFYCGTLLVAVGGGLLSGLILDVSAESCYAALTGCPTFDYPHMAALLEIRGSIADKGFVVF
jgi:hypothetical protein